MARTTPPAQPQRARLTQDEMRSAVRRFKRLIDRLAEFDPNSVEDRRDPGVKALENAIRTAVEKTYDVDTTQWNQYINASGLNRASINMVGPTPINEIREGLERGKNEAIALFESAIDDLQEDLEEHGSESGLAPPIQGTSRDNSNVFVVHGHDDAAKHEVARFIQDAGLNPVILHEQPNQGKTIIEKLEKYSDVGFAVVLLTADDVGRSKDENELQPRARQNVIAELFYFVGKLGRERVCALKKEELEIPSDILGVVYVDLDSAGGWKGKLLKELKATGYDVDWEKALT